MSVVLQKMETFYRVFLADLALLLHKKSVQLWNYRMGVLVDRFEEHEGIYKFTIVSESN